MAPRLSGVQLEVIHLFRRMIRAARLKDGGSGSTTELVRREFREKVYNKFVELFSFSVLTYLKLHMMFERGCA